MGGKYSKSVIKRAERCPTENNAMNRIYVRRLNRMVPIGWYCVLCNYTKVDSPINKKIK